MYLDLFLLSCCLGLSQCLGSYVPCDACDQKALSMCPPVTGGCELVKEPGCGCCLTCALSEGQQCGVYTQPCTQGLRCLPRNGEEKPLHALLHGRGICRHEKGYKEHHPVLAERESREHEEAPTVEITEDPLPAKVLPRAKDRFLDRKAEALRKDKRRKLEKSRAVGPVNYPHYSNDKNEAEYGPCRRQMESILQDMKVTSRIVPQTLYLPNCDRKGFYKRKQCKPSRGRKRGICWCVDKYGLKLPGTDYNGGDIQCQDLENPNNE
ncbi:insulin-like growth factor-binding protein 5 [Polypterus senegalus]|nr:insulin-like growth factor-binding protein 5 [Polypterus senegalus]